MTFFPATFICSRGISLNSLWCMAILVPEKSRSWTCGFAILVKPMARLLALLDSSHPHRWMTDRLLGWNGSVETVGAHG